MRAWLASLGRHKSLKLLSLFLAVALWLAVGGEERTETNLNFTLELLNLPGDLIITSEVPSTLQVQVSGPRGLIRSLSQSRLTHTLDLAGVKAGRQTFPLGVGSFDLPRGVQVVRVQPNPLSLTFTPTITLTLPVQPVFLGHPPEGYELRSVTIHPARVKVKGPADELEGLKFLSTVPIDLTGLTRPATQRVDLNFKDLHLTLVDQAPILADLEIGPKSLKRTFEGFPVVPQPVAAKLSPSQVTLTIRGPWPQMKSLEAKDLKVTVNTEGLSPGRHQLEVRVQLPAGLEVESISPKTIIARIPKP
ncbi:MAG: CdaR family protein [Desulfobaccales bacterium]